eukprot:3358529-Prymnesium_polylepis.2
MASTRLAGGLLLLLWYEPHSPVARNVDAAAAELVLTRKSEEGRPALGKESTLLRRPRTLEGGIGRGSLARWNGR